MVLARSRARALSTEHALTSAGMVTTPPFKTQEPVATFSHCPPEKPPAIAPPPASQAEFAGTSALQDVARHSSDSCA
jgi:hypothetical protein